MALPLTARVYLWLMVALAGGVLAGWLLVAPPPSLGPDAGHVIAVLGQLVALQVVAQHFALPLAERRKFDLSIGVQYAILLIAGAPLAVALAGLGEGLGQGTLALRRDRETGRRMRGVYGALFNTSQAMVAVAAAGAALQAARQAVPEIIGLAVAAGALYVTNTGTVAVMAALSQGKRPWTLWLSGRLSSAALAAGVLALAYLVAETARHDPWVPLVAALPAAMTYASLKRTVVAEAAIQARDEFLSLAAHELRTPMTSLRGYTQLLLANVERRREVLDELDREYVPRALRTIDRQSRKLCSLIDQLLDLSRVQAGKLTLERELVNLTELAHDVVGALQPITPEYELRVQAPEPVFVVADRVRLEQVLTNLITNAAKHAGGGDWIDVEVASASDGQVRLAVRDYGVGIAAEQQRRIFERYYQAPQSRTAGGLGVGLYLSREIVERHDGRIYVESPTGGGARFVIVLPRASGDTAAPCGVRAERIATEAARAREDAPGSAQRGALTLAGGSGSRVASSE
jgi:signal transduction histidine kinase